MRLLFSAQLKQMPALCYTAASSHARQWWSWLSLAAARRDYQAPSFHALRTKYPNKSAVALVIAERGMARYSRIQWCGLMHPCAFSNMCHTNLLASDLIQVPWAYSGLHRAEAQRTHVHSPDLRLHSHTPGMPHLPGLESNV